MRMWVTWLPVFAVALMAAAGCAAERSPVEPDPSGSTVAAVTVRVSGGIQGVSERHRVRRSDPPAAMSPADLTDVFELAGSPAVRAYAGNHLPRGKAACCDRFVYTLTIDHADGSSTTIVTSDAVGNPVQVDELLARLLRGR